MQRRDALRAMVASLAGAIALPFLPKPETLPPHFDPTGAHYFPMESLPVTDFDAKYRQWRDGELAEAHRLGMVPQFRAYINHVGGGF